MAPSLWARYALIIDPDDAIRLKLMAVLLDVGRSALRVSCHVLHLARRSLHVAPE
jgi:hypothetical protein